MFDKVLIANRGEVALRIHRACREMGISTVAVHSTADADAMHVRLADQSVCIGPASPAESYLNIPAIIAAAEITDADAIHPGYGLLSENPRFASIVEEHGIKFIGPAVEHMELMADKLRAKAEMAALGVPVVPGSADAVDGEKGALKIADELGYPVLVKAVTGGGGRGMRLARSADELKAALPEAKAEATAAFGDGRLYLEKFLSRPRHIEVQVLADGMGNVVHLGERDCSVQRRHQKVLEEAPSPALDAEQRASIGATVSAAIERLGYSGLGTVEFLYEDGRFHFIEMNTRLQVEHPVTEMITGIDLVRDQIRIAAGAPLGYVQADIGFRGNAIECRVNAENPWTFVPAPGRITDFHTPGGLGVRVDSALYAGYQVPSHYDSLIAKLIVHGSDRDECLRRLRRALEEFVIGGVETTIPLHQALVEAPDFVTGAYNIHWLEDFVAAHEG
jgi:acetyl-CoA carboxylase biotin carboxylase subunit